MDIFKSINKKKLLDLINRKNPVIFDIGCYDGKDSLELLSINKGSYNICF